jgi:hypothetical protein
VEEKVEARDDLMRAHNVHTSRRARPTHKVVEVEEVVLWRPGERNAEFAGGRNGLLHLRQGAVEERDLFCGLIDGVCVGDRSAK